MIFLNPTEELNELVRENGIEETLAASRHYLYGHDDWIPSEHPWYGHFTTQLQCLGDCLALTWMRSLRRDWETILGGISEPRLPEKTNVTALDIPENLAHKLTSLDMGNITSVLLMTADRIDSLFTHEEIIFLARAMRAAGYELPLFYAGNDLREYLGATTQKASFISHLRLSRGTAKILQYCGYNTIGELLDADQDLGFFRANQLREIERGLKTAGFSEINEPIFDRIDFYLACLRREDFMSAPLVELDLSTRTRNILAHFGVGVGGDLLAGQDCRFRKNHKVIPWDFSSDKYEGLKGNTLKEVAQYLYDMGLELPMARCPRGAQYLRHHTDSDSFISHLRLSKKATEYLCEHELFEIGSVIEHIAEIDAEFLREINAKMWAYYS